jgi:hypothetical protein
VVVTKEGSAGVPSSDKPSLFHLYGQARTNQMARELAADGASLASKGAFLCLGREKAVLLLGQAFIVYAGQLIRLDDHTTMISDALYATLVWHFSRERGLPMPPSLPMIEVVIEGKENETLKAMLGDFSYIPTELSYRKKALDPRDSLSYALPLGFDFSFAGEFKARTLPYIEDSVSIVDVHNEVFLLAGPSLDPAQRPLKFRQLVKTFFERKQRKQLDKVVVSVITLETAPYLAMKYITF